MPSFSGDAILLKDFEIDTLNTENKSIPGAINELNDKIVQIAYFTSDKFSITANTTGNIRIPITGLNGKKIIGGVVQVTGGIPFEVSLNGISSTTSQIFYRGAVDANDRTVRLYVFYM